MAASTERQEWADKLRVIATWLDGVHKAHVEDLAEEIHPSTKKAAAPKEKPAA